MTRENSLYEQWTQRLFALRATTGGRSNLEKMGRLCARLGNPHRSYPTVHVAGTNGKGSVCLKIARALEASGLRVGLYTSPHISSFCERMCVNGVDITPDELLLLLPRIVSLAASEQEQSHFFELTTLAAFTHFAEKNVDVAVIETGLGGRLDATNVVLPRVAVITSISIDHAELLGDTEEKIAREKGGIIKPYVPIVIGGRVPVLPIQKIAEQMNAPLHRVEVHAPCCFDEENSAVAQTALGLLATEFGLSGQHILAGIQQRPSCRFETVLEDPCVIFDVAHNPDGIAELQKWIHKELPGRAVRYVIGLSASKDLRACAQNLAIRGGIFHCISAQHERSCGAEHLKEIFLQLPVNNHHVFVHSTVKEGVLSAVAHAKKEGSVVVVCGTFFIMKEAREALGLPL